MTTNLDARGAITHLRKLLDPRLQEWGFVEASGKGIARARRRADGVYELIHIRPHGQTIFGGLSRALVAQAGLGEQPDTEVFHNNDLRQLWQLHGDRALMHEQDSLIEEIGRKVKARAAERGAGNVVLGGDALWYSDREDIERWAPYLERALPAALARLSHVDLVPGRGGAYSLQFRDMT